MEVLNIVCSDLVLNQSVSRGLSYYVDKGFEVEAPWLGTQKQVAGGGAYKEGAGWTIGLDRLYLAIEESSR